jgi:uncharacterized RDD family membrane protein YckC
METFLQMYWEFAIANIYLTQYAVARATVVAWVVTGPFLIQNFGINNSFFVVVHFILKFCNEVAWLLLFMTNSSLGSLASRGSLAGR